MKQKLKSESVDSSW